MLHRCRTALLLAPLLLGLLLVCCVAQAERDAPVLRIAAAADLEPVLPALLADFERDTHIHTVASYASSATLTTQIENGAPFDLFLAADMGFPQRLMQKGLGAPDASPHPYARGTLVLWSTAAQPLRLDQLASPEVHSIAIANPQHAPYGRAALEALTSLHLLPAVQTKLRTAENIAQAAQFVNSGNAEVGLISLTLARTLSSKGHAESIPQTAYAPIVQGELVLRHGTNTAGAVAFERYLHSAQAQSELRRRGLEPLS